MLKYILKSSSVLVYLALILILLTIMIIYHTMFIVFFYSIIILYNSYNLYTTIKNLKKTYLPDKYRDTYIKLKYNQLELFIDIFKPKQILNHVVSNPNDTIYINLFYHGAYLIENSTYKHMKNTDDRKVVDFTTILRKSKLNEII